MNPTGLTYCRSSTATKNRRIVRFEDLRHSRRKTLSASWIVRAGSQKGGIYTPPTVSETKARFSQLHTTPIPNIYSTVVLELLVQQHFIRHNKKYKYDPIFALGFTSAFDQILEGFESEAKEDILNAYLKSLDEDSSIYRSDATKLEAACRELESGLDGLLSEQVTTSNLLKKSLVGVEENAKNGDFYYSKFFAIGLFRVLELTGFKDPKALERLVSSVGLNLDFVNRDLKLYKTILTKLSAAKEMVKEVTDRERKKAEERQAAAAAAGGGDKPDESASQENGKSENTQADVTETQP